MTYWFTENSLVPLITGALLAIAFLALAFSFREKTMFFAALLVLALTAGTVLTEKMIVTDRELVSDLVHQMAFEVQSNDLPAILNHVSPKLPEVKRRIEKDMPRFRFSTVRINQINSFEIQPTSPRIAIIKFSVWAEATGSGFGHGSDLVQVELTLEETSPDQWRIIDYAYHHGLNANL